MIKNLILIGASSEIAQQVIMSLEIKTLKFLEFPSLFLMIKHFILMTIYKI